jgi:hypothetical protein
MVSVKLSTQSWSGAIDSGTVHVLRQQSAIIFRTLDQWQVFKKIAKVAIRLNPVGFSGFDQGKESSTGCGPVRVAGEQPILPVMWNST